MKLVLKNFKHHREACFDIPETGLVLLSGNSGSGKSTIFKAITYAIYGVVKKPFSHGTTSCEVTLHIKNISITRTNRPNRLVVKYKEDLYEDDSAQSVIYYIFKASHKEFMASSYIVQRSHNSVISMTSIEQSRFIETLAFSDDIHKEYRSKFKEKVKEYKNQHTSILLQIEMLEKDIINKESKLPKNRVEEEETSLLTIESIKLEQLVHKNNITSYEKIICELAKELKKLNEIELKNSTLQEECKILEIELKHFLSQLNKLGEPKKEEDIEILKKNLEKLKVKFKYSQSFLEYKTVMDRAEKFKEEYIYDIKCQLNKKTSEFPNEEERIKLKEKIERMENNRLIFDREKLQIEKEKSEKTESLEKIKNINLFCKKEFIDTYGKLNKKEKALLTFLGKRKDTIIELEQKYKKELDLLKENLIHKKIRSEIYECPCCQKNLQFYEGKLKISEVIVKNEEFGNIEEELLEKEKELTKIVELRTNFVDPYILQLKKSISIIGKKISKPTIIYDHNKNLKDEKQFNFYQILEKEISDLKSKLEEKNFPTSLDSLFKECKNLSKNFPKNFKIDFDITETENTISQLSSNIEEYHRINSSVCSTTREVNIRKRKIQSIKTSLVEKKFLSSSKKLRCSKDVRDEISNIQTNSLECSSELAILQEKFIIVSEYEVYKNNLEEISNIKNELEEMVKISFKIEKKLKGAMGLEEAGREAEILAMKETIESINEHAKYYLEKMFDEPIEVYLHGTKTTAKGDYRTQLNTVVFYKGEESSMEELSGGEEQRCELSFLLAVNDMIGSPIILLDECLNNLDSEINMETITHLRDLAEHKLIFVSSHEAVKGTFDNIIEL
jgi:DNA repair exonuclease SbcCD ATPase subunit